MPGGFHIGQDICNAGAITVSPPKSATANTPGAWTQVAASSLIDVCWMDVEIEIGYDGDCTCAVDIGVGGSGSEIVIASSLLMNGVYNTTNSGTIIGRYSFPIHIPAGTRIAARAQCNTNTTSGAAGPIVTVRVFDGGFSQMEGAAGVDAIGYVSGSTQGTTVTPGNGSAGSYAQLIAATARDYIGIMVAQDFQGVVGANSGGVGELYTDIAIGGSGSEQIILPGLRFAQNLVAPSPVGDNFKPISIPAGTRIAARSLFSSYIAGIQNIGVTLYGVYQ